MSKRLTKPGETSERENYWVVEKTETSWSEPKLISETVGRMTIRWQISASIRIKVKNEQKDAFSKTGKAFY